MEPKQIVYSTCKAVKWDLSHVLRISLQGKVFKHFGGESIGEGKYRHASLWHKERLQALPKIMTSSGNTAGTMTNKTAIIHFLQYKWHS